MQRPLALILAAATLLIAVGAQSDTPARRRLDSEQINAQLLSSAFRVAMGDGSRPPERLDLDERALLEAAVLPAPERVRAMLRLAQTRIASRIADRALAAGAACLLLAQDRTDAVPQLAEREPDAVAEFDDRSNDRELTTLLRGFLAVYKERQQRADLGANTDTLALREARRLLHLASIANDTPPLAVLRPDTQLPAPPSLAKSPLLLHVFPSQLEADQNLNWASATPQALATHTIEAGRQELHLDALPRGTYTLQLSNPSQHPWRVCRPVLVTDLDAVAISIATSTYVMIERRGAPVADATVRLMPYSESFEASAVSAANGIAVLHHDAHTGGRIFITSGADRAVLNCHSNRRSRPAREQTHHHLACDRPLYRPGETVQLRLRLQQHARVNAATPNARSKTTPSLASAPLADGTAKLCVWKGSPHEVVCNGRSDPAGIVTMSLVVPASVAAGAPTIHLQIGTQKQQQVASPFAIANYRRAAIRVAIDAPNDIATGATASMIKVSARYASGAPARGLPAAIQISSRGHKHQIAAVLDANGMATLPLTVSDPRCRKVRVAVDVTSPDGVVVHEEHVAQVAAKRPDREDATTAVHRAPPTELAFCSHAPLVCNRKATIRMTGPPETSAVLAIVREQALLVRRVAFDVDGNASHEFAVPARLGPSVDLLLASAHDDAESRVPVSASPPIAELQLATGSDRYAPGQKVELEVQARTADGQGVAASVTVAVVDERIFALARERSLTSTRSLLAEVPELLWWCTKTAQPTSPRSILAAMLRDGQLLHGTIGGQGLSLPRSTRGAASGAAAAFPGGSIATVRVDFRATAFFAPALQTDEGGAVRASFELPDTLTNYRVSALAIDAEGHSAATTHLLKVTRDLALTPLAPRLLRVGDRVAMPIVVDAHGTGALRSNLTADASDELQLAAEPTTVAIREGLGNRAIQLSAKTAGPAKLRITADAVDTTTQDALADAIDIVVPVQPDDVRRQHWRSQQLAPGKHEITLPAIPAASQHGPLTVRLLDGRSAVLRVATRFLKNYPHGCVEQTLSRILPYWATNDPLTPAENERMQRGLRRLRSLRSRDTARDGTGSGGQGNGFAWWPGGEVDAGMTALVVHGLTHARAAGIQLAHYGLAVDVDSGCFAAAAASLHAAQGRLSASSVMNAELAAASLRIQPDNDRLRKILQQVLQAKQDAPGGLLLRCALAMHAAGDTETAAAILHRFDSGVGVRPPEPEWHRFPGEHEAAVHAHRLELLAEMSRTTANHRTNELAAAAATQLIARFVGNSFGTTYETSSAIVALQHHSGWTGRNTPERTVVLHQNGKRHEVAIGGEKGTADCSLPFEQLTIEVPPGSTLVANFGVATQEPGSTHKAWQSPLQVDRSIWRDGKQLALDKIERGRPIEVRIALRSPVAARYVSIECPLPAGFELFARNDRLEQHDDRVVATLPALTANHRHEIRFLAIPALCGEVRWPPAIASAMYAPTYQGGCAGAVLTIVEPSHLDVDSAAEPIAAIALTRPPRETSRSPQADSLSHHGQAMQALRSFTRLASKVAGTAARAALSGTDPSQLADAAAVAKAFFVADNEAARKWSSQQWRDALRGIERSMNGRSALEAAPPAAALQAATLRQDLFETIARGLLASCTDELPDAATNTAMAQRCAQAIEAVARFDAASARPLAHRLVALLSRERAGGDSDASDDTSDDASEKRWQSLAHILIRYGDELGPVLGERLLPLLTHRDPILRYAAAGALPVELVATIAPSILAHAVGDDWSYEALQRLCLSSAGRNYVRQHWLQASWCRKHAEDLADQLPRDMWAEAPPEAIAAMATIDELPASLSSIQLAAALRVSHDEYGQLAILHRLCQAPSVGAPDLEHIPFGKVMADCIEASRADPHAIARLRAWRSTAEKENAASQIPSVELLAQVAVCLGPALTAAEFLRWSNGLNEEQQTTALAAWSTHRLAELLDQCQDLDSMWLTALPASHLADLEGHLVALASRCPSERSAIEATLARIPARATRRTLLHVGAVR
ncbi:MAG: alpha-2-macroglobulin family protein [Planctomycetota bacterium]